MRYVVLALVALSVGSKTASAQAWADKMFKEGTTKDFGTVPHGAQLFHKFPITNIYAVRMEITKVRSSCGCATPTASTTVLEPRQTGYIEVKMDTTRFTGQKSLVIYVSVGPEYTSTAELKVSATSRGDVVFNPGEVNLGTVQRGQTPTQSIDVDYAGVLDWRISGVVTNGAPLDAVLKEHHRRPGQVGYQVAVTLKGEASPGVNRWELLLKTNDPASPLVPLLVTATIEAPLTVTPATLTVSPSKAGEEVFKSVVIRGSKPFLIVSVEGLGEGITAELPTAAALVQIVKLKFQLTTPGDFQRKLQIKTDLDKEAPVAVPVEGKVPAE